MEVEEAALRDWVEILKNYRTEEVNSACRDYEAYPRRTKGGHPIRPVPGDIVQRIDRARASAAVLAKATAPESPGEPRQVVTPEQATAILAEVYGGKSEAGA